MMQFIIKAKGYREAIARLVAHIYELDNTKTWAVVIKQHKETRSRAQNAVLHMWMEYISKRIHDAHGVYIEAEKWKHHLVEMLLGTDPIHIGDKVSYMRKSTAKLSTKEFAYLLEGIDMYVSSEYPIRLPHPDYLYRYAITGEK